MGDQVEIVPEPQWEVACISCVVVLLLLILPRVATRYQSLSLISIVPLPTPLPREVPSGGFYP